MEYLSISLNTKTGQVETFIGNRVPYDGVSWDDLASGAKANPDILALYKLERIA
jgi:hypothetical protein